MNSLRLKLIAFSFALLSGLLGIWIASRDLVPETPSALYIHGIDSVPVEPLENADDMPCDWLATGRKLEASEAVKVAECFVRANGYTKHPPIADRSKLTRESVAPGTDELGLKIRHNSLEPEAFGYRKSELYGGGWEIAFRHVRTKERVKFFGEEAFKKQGRCVWMNDTGENPKMMHSGCFFFVAGFTKIYALDENR